MAGGTTHMPPCLILNRWKKCECSEKVPVSLALVSHLPQFKKKSRKVDHSTYFKGKVLCLEQCAKISQDRMSHTKCSIIIKRPSKWGSENGWKGTGSKLSGLFFPKAINNSYCPNWCTCQILSYIPSKALGKGLRSTGNARKIWHFAFRLLSFGKLTMCGFVSKSFAASKICTYYMSLSAFVLCTSMQHQYSGSSWGTWLAGSTSQLQ